MIPQWVWSSTALRILATVLLTCLSYGLMVWVWSGLHVNIVIINYLRAGAYFWHSADPYVETLKFGASNQFKYSPLFAMAVAPLVHLTPGTVLPVWVVSSALCFWWGVVQWVNGTWKQWCWCTPALMACTVELVTSLGIYQINALVMGLTLLGLAACRDGRVAVGGALLMLATNLKVFPGIFLVACLWRGGWKYIVGAAGTGAVTFLLPALVVGLEANIALHTSWFSQVTHDTIGAGILDVCSALARLGAPSLGQALWWSIVAMSMPLFGLVAVQRQVSARAWHAWGGLGLCTYVLLSPRTEVATFIVVGPVYVLLSVMLIEIPARRACALSESGGRLAPGRIARAV